MTAESNVPATAGYLPTIMATIKSNVGIAIMTMPYAFSRGGWLGSAILFGGCALAASYCVHLYLLVIDDLRESNSRVAHGAPTNQETMALMGGATVLESPDTSIVPLSPPFNPRNTSLNGGGDSDASPFALDDNDDSLPATLNLETIDLNDTTMEELDSDQELDDIMAASPSTILKKEVRTLRAVAYASTRNSKLIARLADASLFTVMFGACMAYVAFVSRSFHRLLPIISRQVYVWILIFLYTPMAWTRKVSGLVARVSGLGVFVLFLGGLVYLAETLYSCEEAASVVEKPPAIAWSTMAEAFGIAAFSNEGLVALSAPIYAEFNPAKRHRFRLIAFATIALLLSLNSSIGYVGVYCSKPTNVITDGLRPHESWVDAIIVISMTIQVLSTFPPVSFVMLQSMDSFLPSFVVNRRPIQVGFRIVLLWAICLMGGYVDNVGALVALFGGLANAAVTFVLPCVFFLMNFYPQGPLKHLYTTGQGALISVILVLAATGGILATIVAIQDLAAVEEGEPLEE